MFIFLVGGANYLREIIEVRSHAATPIYVLLIHVISAYLAYVIGKFACKIVIQGKAQFFFARSSNFLVLLPFCKTMQGVYTGISNGLHKL